MKPIDENQRNRYFIELAVELKRDGLETIPLEDVLLPVLLDAKPSVKSVMEAMYGIDWRI